MDLLDILLITVAVGNLLFAGFVYVHSSKSFVVLFYSLISVFASLWTLATFLTRIDTLPYLFAKLALEMHYVMGFLAYLAFLWFALFYPKKVKKGLWLGVLLTILGLSYISLIPFTPLVLDHFSLTGSLAERVIFNIPGYAGFILLLSATFFSGIFVLLNRFLKARRRPERDEFDRYQIYFAILANFVAGILGISLNLILPFFGNFSLFYVNPVLVTVALISIGMYNLAKYNLFNLRVIFAEIFTIAIWVIALFRLASASTIGEWVFEGVVFAVTLIIGFLLIRSVLREVKQRERLQTLTADLEKANSRLRMLDQQKSEFVSIASHQLRSPLTAIMGYASMLVEGSFGKIPEGAKDALSRIEDSSRLMASSVEDFLNVSRIEQGSMKYDKSTFDVVSLARTVYEEQKPVAEKKGLALIAKLPKEEMLIYADLGKIKQVFTNLVDNSIKYTPRGTVTIRVEQERNVARFSVSDTGVGIAPSVLPKLFDKFVRSRNAHEVNVTGTGLGLYVAKEMVNAHEGKIWAESEGEGKGSSFFVELKLASPQKP